MGVTHLWEIIREAKSDITLDDMRGKTFAVDLATWICESEGVKPLKGFHARGYLRNLFFRLGTLIRANVHVVFVLDGKAPNLKLVTIARRLASSSGSPKKQSSGIRSRLNSKLHECCTLLDSLGIPWIKAEGEAEALCAELNKIGLVDGVITNDGDAFLYGARTVIRNFTSDKNSIIEQYTICAVEERFGFGRNDLIAFGLLLGCDYYPKGVTGIGAAQATKLLSSFKDADSLKVLQKWRLTNQCHNFPFTLKKSSHCSNCSHEGLKKDHAKEGCGSCGDKCGRVSSSGQSHLQSIPCLCDWHKNEHKMKLYNLEEKIKLAALQDPSFPDKNIIEEFSKQQKYINARTSIPADPSANAEYLSREFKEQSPNIEKACRYLNQKLDWSLSYALEKVLPFLTNFLLSHPSIGEWQIKMKGIVKKRVKDFVASLEVQWMLLSDSLQAELPDTYVSSTTESEDAMRAIFPHEVEVFLQRLEQKKEERKRTKAEARKAERKSKVAAKKNEMAASCHKMTDYFKVRKERKAPSAIDVGKVDELEIGMQSLLVSCSTVGCQANMRSTIETSCQSKNLTEHDEAGHSDTTVNRRIHCPVILFSSDSESETNDDEMRSNNHGQIRCVDPCGKQITTPAFTDQALNSCRDPDVTFSNDINFSLGSSFLNFDDESVSSLPVRNRDAQLSFKKCTGDASNCKTSPKSSNSVLKEPYAALGNSKHSTSECDSPVYMTLMERLIARKNMKL